MPKKEKIKGFRIAQKEIGLTYSCPRSGECCNMSTEEKARGEHLPDCNCDNPIHTHQELIDFLDEKGINQYIIGKEHHKSGKVHWHVYVKYDNVIDSIDPRIFDCNRVHPNIVKGKAGKGWMAYCTKEKEYETNFYATDPFKKAMMCSNVDEAIDMLWQTRTEDMCKQGDRIEENLRRRMTTKATEPRYDGPYPSEFYPTDWKPETHSLLIVGPPGLNKTQFAKYLLRHMYGDYDYVKGDLEPLKKCRWDKPILFDEVHMLGSDRKYVDPEQSKEITDVENGGTIHMRFKNVSIPPGVKRVFVHNKLHPFRNPSDAVYGRRVHTHVINGPCAEAMAASVHASQAALHATAAATHAANAVTQMSEREMSVRQTMEARHRKTISTQKGKLEKDSADGKRPLSKFICAELIQTDEQKLERNEDDDFIYFARQ
jgi:hypothetical protein